MNEESQEGYGCFSRDGKIEDWGIIYEIALHMKKNTVAKLWNPSQEKLFRSIEAIALEKDLEFKEVLIKNHMANHLYWGDKKKEEVMKQKMENTKGWTKKRDKLMRVFIEERENV